MQSLPVRRVGAPARALIQCLAAMLSQPRVPDDWACFALSLPRAPFIVWLANEVAIGMISGRGGAVAIEHLIARVDAEPAGHLQQAAERFLRKQCLFAPLARQDRVIVVFRHLIQRKLTHSK